MTNLDALWVLPSDIDESLDIDTIDPTDVELLKEYEIALAACEFASQTLWALSGRKYHTGSVTAERYIPTRGRNSLYGVTTIPGTSVFIRDYGTFIVDPYDWDLGRIHLDGTPIKTVSEVRSIASGEVLDPTTYNVINRAFLRLNSGSLQGIEVSYTFGVRPPKTGHMAALAMATQFFFLWSGRQDQCSLPDRVTAVTRQNVSWVLLDNQDFLDDLKTGIYIVDLFLKQVNPDKARAKAKVFSVDLPRGRRRMF